MDARHGQEGTRRSGVQGPARRSRLAGALVAVAMAVAGVIGLQAATATAAPLVTPTVSCGSTAGSVRTYWFGYTSTAKGALNYRPGTTANGFSVVSSTVSPLAFFADQGQVDQFRPGTFSSVFAVRVPVGVVVRWTVNGASVTTGGLVLACPSPWLVNSATVRATVDGGGSITATAVKTGSATRFGAYSINLGVANLTTFCTSGTPQPLKVVWGYGPSKNFNPVAGTPQTYKSTYTMTTASSRLVTDAVQPALEEVIANVTGSCLLANGSTVSSKVDYWLAADGTYRLAQFDPATHTASIAVPAPPAPCAFAAVAPTAPGGTVATTGGSVKPCDDPGGGSYMR